MRFRSVRSVVDSAVATFLRFPLVLSSAFVAAVLCLLDTGARDLTDVQVRVLLAATLGLPLFVAVSLLEEKRAWRKAARSVLQGAGVAVLVAYFVTSAGWTDEVRLRRYVQFSLAGHLLVACLPYLHRGELNGFWQYNKTLFLRFLVAVLYGGVLFAGFAVALLAVDNLLEISVPDASYMRLWILTSFVFTTWFFLAGMPRDLHGLDATTAYPKGLRVFSQFILLPIVAVYLGILTIYIGKIALTRTWPSGWIGYLVSTVAAVGILSLLLVFPIQEEEENRWVRNYARWFYVALLPAVVTLLLAVSKRIGQYGITENRYFLVVISLWLAAVSLYFVLGRSKNIKTIPATLLALALLTSCGPWGAYGVSARSQSGRLAQILTARGILADGRIRRAEGPLRPQEEREISAILDYLLATHGEPRVASWFPEGLHAAANDGVGETARSRGARERARATAQARGAMRQMGLEYVEPGRRQEQRSFSYWSPNTRVVLITGYEYAFTFERASPSGVSIEGRNYRVDEEPDGTALRLLEGEKPLLALPLDAVIEKALPGGRQASHAAPVEDLTLTAESERLAVMVVLQRLSGNAAETGPVLTDWAGTLYLRFKTPH